LRQQRDVVSLEHAKFAAASELLGRHDEVRAQVSNRVRASNLPSARTVSTGRKRTIRFSETTKEADFPSLQGWSNEAEGPCASATEIAPAIASYPLDPPNPYPCPCCGGRMIAAETFGRAGPSPIG
jgi:hypothetical protein